MSDDIAHDADFDDFTTLDARRWLSEDDDAMIRARRA